MAQPHAHSDLLIRACPAANEKTRLRPGLSSSVLISGAQQSVRRWVVELPVAVSVVCLVVVEQPVVDPRCSTVTPSRFGPVAAPPATPPTPAPTAAPTGPPAAAPAAAPVAAPAAAPRSSA